MLKNEPGSDPGGDPGTDPGYDLSAFHRFLVLQQLQEIFSMP